MSIYITRHMLNPEMFPLKADQRPGVLRRWMQSLVRRWRRRKMIMALEAMDDRLLRDIGINRADIKRAVDGFDDRELRMAPLAPVTMISHTDNIEYREAA
ncbi:DUF1127 domain-containing protein [Hoeflea sp.]|jgi:uncharacterized protein YjiS (DUF1127 family)|uniref:DUF1127 domain-containing protein n=1 Tax=Hoeflea sp. TaxID=1940281 RepID=UPI002AFFD928|nr:DUF1127 domain-containing protein [Hoeflea sp.]